MSGWKRYAVFAAIAAQPVIAQAQETAEPQVVLDADSILVDDVNNQIIAEGNVEAEYEGRVMRADRLIYNRTTNRVRATGNIVIIDPDGTERFADEIETDANLADGYAIGFSMRMPDGGVAVAQAAAHAPDGVNALDRIVYTSCELCEEDSTPTWALRARRAVVNPNNNMMSYRDAVLEIGGIPVVYLPYFAHPDPESERRSGFLAPDFGTSSKLGLFYQQPYYWAISPYQDLTISPQVNGNVNPLLEFNYRKRFWSGQFNADFSFTNETDFDSDGEPVCPLDENGLELCEEEWRSHLFADGRFNITRNWNWGFGVEEMTDDLYSRRYDISGENDERGLYVGQPLRLLNQIYTQGQAQNWYADATLLSIQGQRASDNDDTFPTTTPIIFSERLFDFGDNGLLSVNASSTLLNREIGVDSGRVSVGADWATSRVLPGGVLIRPFAETRVDYYELDDTPDGETSVDRSVATAGATLSYPLYRPGKSVDLIIEPTAMVALGTKGANDPSIPVEDSLLYEFDESSLFDANAVGGYDLYEGGNRASLGLSATARWKNGVNITALGGRRWRSEDDPAFSEASNLDGNNSDWIGSISADIGRTLSLETRVRIDDESYDINRIDAGLRTRFWRLQGSARYYRVASDITETGIDDEGIVLQGQVKLTDQYYFVYARNRDITGDRDLTHDFGIAYEDDCSRFEVVFSRSEAVDRTLGPNDSLKFRFSLKTLGDFGSQDVD
ncbi:MAG: LPS assembly protein LptD [Henriciella sp.]|nr:LPS assembly protein LptD [Henriciella sp.]